MKHKIWKEELPRVRPFYAVKCNSRPEILNLMVGLGTGFDVASTSELTTMVKDLKVPSTDIIFANPYKSLKAIKHALSNGVSRMTFDNGDELMKIAKVVDENPDLIKPELVVRIKVDDSQSHIKLSLKFGAELEDVPKLFKEAKKLDLNIVGVAFHVGSKSKSADAFGKAIRDAKSIFDISKDYGYKFKVLDIGGGWPGVDEHMIAFTDFTLVTRKALEKYFPLKKYKKLQIIAEPGRYFPTGAIAIVTQITSKKITMKDDGPRYNYYLNDGLYGSFREHIIVEHQVLEPVPIHEAGLRESYKSDLWGPTCSTNDMIGRELMVPEMYSGEWFAFRDMGAYTFVVGSVFNGFPMPSVRSLVSGEGLKQMKTFKNWNNLKHIFSLG